MKNKLIIFLCLIVICSCKQEFQSPINKLSADVLIMDGFINTGNVESVITLSKLQDLKDTTSFIPELNAQVQLQEEAGTSVNFVNAGKGKYTLPARTYNAGKRYRLLITRSNGRKYESDFVAITATPPIDNLSYRTESNGVTILLNTHDVPTASRYFYWNYEETWQFKVPFPSKLVYKNKQFIKRVEDIEYCFRTEKSNKLILGSSVKFTDNKIEGQEIQFADNASGRISLIYSILVSQHAVSKEYFDYLEKLKKNTETIGSIFDAQPTQNIGNLHSVSNKDEFVVGFFNLHSVQTKRLFIKANELPAFPPRPEDDCMVQEFDLRDRFGNVIFDAESSYGDSTKLIPLTYTVSNTTAVVPECGDCRIKGALMKPSFWPF
ncbi:MAG: DUF4249 domain-containing protein [Sphingobacteriales bacterium]|nr:MAG: DUF4249 domain-containing protein [Sphingobacteriales bacterium]